MPAALAARAAGTFSQWALTTTIARGLGIAIPQSTRSCIQRGSSRGLETRGWMRRSPDPDDRRATLAFLTEQGWDKVVATAPGHAAEVQRLVFANLSTADVSHLRRITERILRTAKPDLCLPETADSA